MCGLLSGPLNRSCTDHQRYRCPRELLRPKWRNENAAGWCHEDHVCARSEKRFGLVIDTARAEPVLIEKYGRGVVVVVSAEEYERLFRSIWAGGQGETRTRGRLKVTISRDELAPLAGVPA